MPNWCEGTLKVRGRFEDVKRWAQENINVYRTEFAKDSDGHTRIEYVPVNDAISFNSDSTEFEMQVKQDSYINSSRRHFIEPGTYYCWNRESTVLVLRFKAAWGIDEEPFIKMSKKYKVDFRLYGCEMGMEFNQEVIVEHGKLIKNDEINFDDYVWDCPFPDLGG